MGMPAEKTTSSGRPNRAEHAGQVGPAAELPADVLEAVATLGAEFSRYAMVLFGSRAAGGARKYSDVDLGIFRDDGGGDLREFASMRVRLDELQENVTLRMDLVDLSAASPAFLAGLRGRMIHLGGSHRAWVELERRVDHEARV